MTKSNKRTIIGLDTIYEDYDYEYDYYDPELGLQKTENSQKTNNANCFCITVNFMSTVIISSVFTYIIFYVL